MSSILKRAVLAAAGVAAIAGGVAPAHATGQIVCTGDQGLPNAYVNFCEDVQIADGNIVSTAGGLYVCTGPGSCTLIRNERSGAGYDPATGLFCYAIYGNGGRGWQCIVVKPI